MKSVLDNIFGFFISDKFYLPILYILIGVIIYHIATYIITKISKVQVKVGNKNDKLDKKRLTMISLIRNIVKYAIGVFVILAILEVYGIDTTKIIASLGILGAVIGLAFQDIIKDLIAGFFIIFDNQYSVGDYVKINDFTGEVLNLGLQTTKLKDFYGDVYTINNSSISSVVNYSEYDTVMYLNIPISYNTDIDKLEKVLTKLKTKVRNIENVTGDLTLLGLDSFNSSDMTYKVTITTKPYKYFNVKRAFFKLIKQTFDKEGIEIPFSQVDVHIK